MHLQMGAPGRAHQKKVVGRTANHLMRFSELYGAATVKYALMVWLVVTFVTV